VIAPKIEVAVVASLIIGGPWSCAALTGTLISGFTRRPTDHHGNR